MFLKDIFIILFTLLLQSSQVLSFRCNQKAKTLTLLVRDVIENELAPSVLWSITQWTKDDKFNFVRTVPFHVQMADPTIPIELPLDGSANKQWFFVNMNCVRSPNFLSIINPKYFAHPYRWIIADGNNDSIQNLTFLPDSNIILANQESNTNKYILKQVYQIGKGDSFIYENFGIWSQENGFVDTRTTRILSRRRRDLKGHRLVAATVFMEKGSENYTDLDDYHHNRVDTVSKLSYQITKHWVDSVNATMHSDVHRTWGYQDPKTGHFSGMSGQLERKEADIGGTVIFMTSERVPILDYHSVAIHTKMGFIIRSPPISYVSNIYYLPFTGVVWICSILLVILSTIVIAITLKFHMSTDKGEENKETFDYLLFAVASTCQMGSDIITKVLSARISMFFFFVALLFIYTSFTANIVALLQSTTKSIRTIGDLQNPAIEVGVHDTPFNRHYFKFESDPIKKHLYNTKIAPPNEPDAYMNITHGIARLREGMFAFHVEASPGYLEVERTFFENEKCGLVEIPFILMTDTWCVTQKQSPYKEILKVNILKIREHGIQQREKSRVYTNRPNCDSDGKNFGSVRLIDCYAAIFIFIYGSLASLAVFGIESLINSKMRQICTSCVESVKSDMGS